MLVWGENSLSVTEGEVFFGRGSECDVVLDDPLVSRRHARLNVTRSIVTIEDLMSSNGVYVNGLRIDGAQPLYDGDRLLLATREVSVFEYRSAPGSKPARESRPSIERPSPSAAFPTERADPFVVLGRVADKLFEGGRAREAERMLQEHLITVLEGARSALLVPDEVSESASNYAVKLATATREGKWIDYAVELHLRARRLMSPELVEAICSALPGVPGIDLDLFRYYLELLRSQAASMSRPELERVNRLACLNVPRR
jgi:hypothetical protein